MTDAVVTARSATTVITNRLVIPLQFVFYLSCVPEEVMVTGSLHLLIHRTLHPDGSVNGFSQQNFQGVTGTGPVTGNKYQVVDVSHAREGFHINAGEQVTIVTSIRFLGPGPGNNHTLHANFHITINANGELINFINRNSVECK